MKYEKPEMDSFPVEELMEKLKNGSDTDRAIRNEIVNTGIITIVARTRSEYTGNH